MSNLLFPRLEVVQACEKYLDSIEQTRHDSRLRFRQELVEQANAFQMRWSWIPWYQPRLYTLADFPVTPDDILWDSLLYGAQEQRVTRLLQAAEACRVSHIQLSSDDFAAIAPHF